MAEYVQWTVFKFETELTEGMRKELAGLELVVPNCLPDSHAPLDFD